MSENWSVQVSYKVSQNAPMFNLRGDSVADVAAQVDELNDKLDAFMSLGEAMKAVDVVNVTPPSGGRQSTPQAAAPSSDGVPVCSHGTYEYRSGTNQKTGKPWSGYFCPSKDRNDQHDPKWNR